MSQDAGFIALDGPRIDTEMRRDFSTASKEPWIPNGRLRGRFASYEYILIPPFILYLFFRLSDGRLRAQEWQEGLLFLIDFSFIHPFNTFGVLPLWPYPPIPLLDLFHYGFRVSISMGEARKAGLELRL